VTRVYSYVSRTEPTMVMPAFRKASPGRPWVRVLALLGWALVLVPVGAALGLLAAGWALS
jgi:hypothetical protein